MWAGQTKAQVPHSIQSVRPQSLDSMALPARTKETMVVGTRPMGQWFVQLLQPMQGYSLPPGAAPAMTRIPEVALMTGT